MAITMTTDLQISLIKLQRILSQTWGKQTQDKQQDALSPSEFEYLACVYIAENAFVSEDDTAHDIAHDSSSHLSAIAAELQVQKSSASLMVNKLERRALIYRVTCQYDARAQHILLTDRGLELFLETQASVFKNLAASLKAILDEEEFQRFEKTLAKICHRI
jgi:DNA-binding MarR family transcriptional regulator